MPAGRRLLHVVVLVNLKFDLKNPLSHELMSKKSALIFVQIS